MSDELERRFQDDGVARQSARPSRAVKKADTYHDYLQLKAFKAAGQARLAAHVMEQITDLHRYRQHLAGNDPELNRSLAAVEEAYVKGMTTNRRGRNNPVWGF